MHYCTFEIQVMSKGQLKEFDSPYNLLQNPQSLLHDMVKKTGPSASRQLQKMALAAHLARQQLQFEDPTTPTRHCPILKT